MATLNSVFKHILKLLFLSWIKPLFGKSKTFLVNFSTVVQLYLNVRCHHTVCLGVCLTSYDLILNQLRYKTKLMSAAAVGGIAHKYFTFYLLNSCWKKGKGPFLIQTLKDVNMKTKSF